MKRKVISVLLCVAMLFAVCAAGMTAGAEDSVDLRAAAGYSINSLVKVNGTIYQCTDWWVTTPPPGECWKEIGPDNGTYLGVPDLSAPQRSITVRVQQTGDKKYMGYGTLNDVLNDPAGNKLRNYIPCDSITLNQGEPIILYMTEQIPGAWYLATYDDCVLLELTDFGVRITGVSYDWTGIKNKETNNYKLTQEFNWEGSVLSAKISYDSNFDPSGILFDWKESTTLQCGLYKTYSSVATYWQNFSDITWTSSNNNIISIIEPDWFWIQHPGKTTLTATTADGKTQSIDITVNVDLTMKLGETRVQIGEKLFQSTGTTGYMEYPTKIQYLTNSSGTYTTMAPVRFLGESIGYKVVYTEETKDIKLTDNVDGHYICMRLNEKTIYSYNADGVLRASFDLPVPVTLIEGSTYAPLRTIAEYSGFHCQFISNAKGDYVILDDYPDGLTDNDYKERISSFEEYYYHP